MNFSSWELWSCCSRKSFSLVLVESKHLTSLSLPILANTVEDLTTWILLENCDSIYLWTYCSPEELQPVVKLFYFKVILHSCTYNLAQTTIFQIQFIKRKTNSVLITLRKRTCQCAERPEWWWWWWSASKIALVTGIRNGYERGETFNTGYNWFHCLVVDIFELQWLKTRKRVWCGSQSSDTSWCSNSPVKGRSNKVVEESSKLSIPSTFNSIKEGNKYIGPFPVLLLLLSPSSW